MRINTLRKSDSTVIVQGLHLGIIQSMLDYDYLLNKEKPSVMAVIAKGRKKERFFWGSDEVEIPLFASLSDIPAEQLKDVIFLVNVQSARNVKNSIQEALELLPALQLVTIFAEGTPEIHANEIRIMADERGVLVVGPSSVGMLLPGFLKLGAIGGTMYEQLVDARIKCPGDVAVITTSGGMINELIRVVTGRGRGVSFAVAMGGDMYPALDPANAVLLAEADPKTKEIIFFGELGGTDEYRIAELIKTGKIKKRIIAYIAGVVAELFPNPPQFGHAKALAQSDNETAGAKKDTLRSVGVVVCDRFDEIATALNEGSITELEQVPVTVQKRKKAYFMSHLSGEKQGSIQLLGNDLLETVNNNTLSGLVLSVLLGETVTSKKLIEFTDFVLKLLIDHSPNVSGAVNTMITARAGKDLVSSLTAGLLTVGPRFGGAINGAASAWIEGVEKSLTAREFVGQFTKQSGVIPGIGHKKYRLDMPDPRVEALAKYVNTANGVGYLQFARTVESVTSTKKANLILNVDGAIAAVMLDLLVAEMGYSPEKLKELVDIEFFNSLFVISRSIGFVGHYLDQRRNDEGLFRLNENDLRYFR